MTGLLISLAGIFLLCLAWWLSRRRNRRRRELLASPFPESWESILRKDLRLYRRMPPELREKLRRTLRVIAGEKHFEACGGLDEITDEMRVLIAAQAALLLIGLKRHDYYPRLRSILVYPTAFRDRGRRRFGLPDDEDEERDIRLGESWDSGSVVLAWDSVRRGAANADDGMNVVLHEFAHQLDQADGSTDGAPVLSERSEYRDWAAVLGRDYEELVEEAEDPRSNPLLDTYGAENPAEFFAVATETFFEKPRQLRRDHPELYRELSGYYGLDPVSWSRR